MSGAAEFDVFISYASADSASVLPLVERLKADGCTVWIDREQMLGGLDVLNQLADAIANSAQTIAFLTDAYLERDYTTFELNSSMNRDPASRLPRTIPVVLQPITREVPNAIKHLTWCDMTRPDGAEPTYQQILRSIQQTPRRPKAGVDAESAALACAAPRQHLAEPEVALFLIGRAADALARFLYLREIGEPPPGASHEALAQALMVSGKIPTDRAQSLAFIRTFGNFVVHDRADRTMATQKSIEPALDALRELSAWAFPDRPLDDAVDQVLAELPRIGDSGELQLLGTSLRLREGQLGRTGLGRLFAGRDTAGGEAVSVVLLEVAAEGEAAFLERAGRFVGLTQPELVTPIDAGTVQAPSGARCQYLVFEATSEISARELADRHGGRVPAGPAYEIGLTVTRALAALHAARPPLAYGVVTPADVLISRFGSVRLRCPGRDPESPEADLRAAAALLSELTGTPAADAQRMAGCRNATQLRHLLEKERAELSAEPTLRSLLRLTPPPDQSRPGPQLIESYPVRARRAWPLGDGRVLVWESDTETLAAYDGPRQIWRDTALAPLRVAVSAAGGQVAVGGWDGAVRWFAGAEPVAVTSLDGTVGDLRFVDGGLVAGSWKRSLIRLGADRERRPLLEATNGVHRIAVAEHGDRFAVADLAGRVAVYHHDVRVRDWQQFDAVTDLAYAGSRLVLLTDSGLTGLGLDDRTDGFEPKPGALRLLPGAAPGACLLLVTADPRRPDAAPLEVWSIDQDDRHILQTTFPAGYRVGSTCAARGRFTVELPGGGCAYWRDDAEQRVWPDALSATLAPDGRQIAVCLGDRVELYVEQE